MHNHVSRVIRYFMLLMLAFAQHASAAQTGTSSLIRLGGHMPTNATANAEFIGNLEASAPVPMTFTLPLRNQDELDSLLQRLYDPADELYGKYLTSEEFIERFAPTQDDYEKVVFYAKSLGLTVTGRHPNRTLLNVSGTTGAIESAFKLRLENFALPSGREFYAPNENPEVPASIASVISGIVGLDNHAVWRPFYRIREGEAFAAVEGSQASPSGPGGGYAPADLTKAYNLTTVSAKGSGQVIALFELGGYQASDINMYTSYFGLPAAKLKNVLVDGGSGGGINPEVTLDIELALALAPNSQIYVYEGPNSNRGVLDTYNRIATDNVAKQVSTSWGLGEDLVNSQYLQSESAIFKQMAAQGQSIYAAAGDSGAYDDYDNTHSQSLVVDDPASQPYVTSVGGTKLLVNSGSGAYGSESVWNNGLGNGAGGGGVSGFWPIPSWQSNVSTVSSTTHRNVPDVALNADTNTGYAIYHGGKWQVFGGTSCAAPLWAAFTACVNQELEAGQKAPMGYANPLLYAIGIGSTYGSDFHDVTAGDNLYYHAGEGYDNATGWGSFNGLNLFATLTNTSPTPPPPAPVPPAPEPVPPPPAPEPVPPEPTPPPPVELVPVLDISMSSHPQTFRRMNYGTYTIEVTNSGTGPTNEPVGVEIKLPRGLTIRSISGSGWNYDSHSHLFTRDDILESGESYPPLNVKVYVHYFAAREATAEAVVVGGGSEPSETVVVTPIKR